MLTIWRMALVVAFVSVSAAMHFIGARINYACDSGLLPLLHNVLSAVFVLLCGASFYAAGALLLSKKYARSALDRFLISSIVGFCAFQVLGYVIGLLSLLTFGLSLLLLALPLCAFPKAALPPYGWNRRERMLVAAFSAAGIYVLCFSGILHQYVENDFSHYYAFYDSALRNATLLPYVNMFDYFYMKGAGTAFLMMAATTKFSMPLVTLYAMLMMALIVYRMCAMLTSDRFAPVACALLLLASKYVRIESFKGHTLISMLLMAVPYFMIRIRLGRRFGGRSIHLALVLLVSSILVLSPAAAVFLVLPSLLYLYFCLRNGSGRRLFFVSTFVGVPIATFAVSLLSNYLLTGMPEVTPLPVFIRLFDFDVTRHWISESAIMLSRQEFLAHDGLDFQRTKFLALLGQMAAGGVLYAIARRYLFASHRTTLLRLETVLAFTFALGAVCPVLYLTMRQSSVQRFMVFYSAIQALYVCIGVVLALAIVYSLARGRFRIAVSRRRVGSVLFAVMAAYALIFNWTPRLSHQVASTKFFFGAAAMPSVLGHWYSPEVQAIDAHVGDGGKVLPLYFLPYATLYRPATYLPHVLNPLTHDMLVLLHDAEASRKAYLERKIRYFVVNLTTDTDPMLSMTYEGYGDLFSPENIGRHFRVRKIIDDIWLMVLDGAEADGQRPSEEFLAAYERRRSFDIGNPRNIFYPALMRSEQLYPALFGKKP